MKSLLLLFAAIVGLPLGCALSEDVAIQAAEAELVNCVQPALESKLQAYEAAHEN